MKISAIHVYLDWPYCEGMIMLRIWVNGQNNSIAALMRDWQETIEFFGVCEVEGYTSIKEPNNV